MKFEIESKDIVMSTTHRNIIKHLIGWIIKKKAIIWQKHYAGMVEIYSILDL